MIGQAWRSAWEYVTPFMAFEPEVRRVIYTTNAIESVNARIRKAVKARGHFPTETAAMKCVYMAIMSLDPTGTGRQRWAMRWKAPLNAFAIAFPGRIIETTKYPGNLTSHEDQLHRFCYRPLSGCRRGGRHRLPLAWMSS